jgi:hypothetical protein
MPLDLGDDPARLRPACGPVVEVGVIPANMVRWPPDRTLEQVADPVLQDPVRRKPDRVFDPFGFKIFVDIRIGEAGIGAEIDARYLAAIARHDTIKHTLPAIGAVDVAGTKRAALQIAARKPITIHLSLQVSLMRKSPRFLLRVSLFRTGCFPYGSSSAPPCRFKVDTRAELDIDR